MKLQDIRIKEEQRTQADIQAAATPNTASDTSIIAALHVPSRSVGNQCYRTYKNKLFIIWRRNRRGANRSFFVI